MSSSAGCGTKETTISRWGMFCSFLLARAFGFLGAGPRPAIVLPPVGVNNIVCVFDYNVLYSWCSCARGGLWSWTVFSPGPFLYLWGWMWGALVVCWVPVFMPFLGPVAGRKSPQKVRTRSYSHGLNDNNRNSDIALTSANNKTAG